MGKGAQGTGGARLNVIARSSALSGHRVRVAIKGQAAAPAAGCGEQCGQKEDGKQQPQHGGLNPVHNQCPFLEQKAAASLPERHTDYSHIGRTSQKGAMPMVKSAGCLTFLMVSSFLVAAQ